MKTTRKLQLYIREHEVNIEELAEVTGVSKELMSGKVSRALNATELLEVCAYLKIDPKEISGI